ncbi:MAG: phosphodiesterase [Geminicoccaceae bacterium]
MSKVIQITDTHIVPNGQLAYGKVDTAAALEKAVGTINRILPEIGPVDLVVVTGDLTDFGSIEEYHRFRDIMTPLSLPYRAVPGNHDDRETMRAAFADQDWMPKEGPIDWITELSDFVLVGLDTLVPGSSHGQLAEGSLAFLKKSMADHPAKPFLIGLHHPPFATGIHGMDIRNLLQAAPLRDILIAHPDRTRLICGHVHRNIVTAWGSIICQIAPGISHAVTLEQRVDATHTLTIEPGAFMLHEMREQNLTSHHVQVGRYDGPHPFYLTT